MTPQQAILEAAKILHKKRKPKPYRPHMRVLIDDDKLNRLLLMVRCVCGHVPGFMDRFEAHKNPSYVDECAKFFERKMREHRRELKRHPQLPRQRPSL